MSQAQKHLFSFPCSNEVSSVAFIISAVSFSFSFISFVRSLSAFFVFRPIISALKTVYAARNTRNTIEWQLFYEVSSFHNITNGLCIGWENTTILVLLKTNDINFIIIFPGRCLVLFPFHSPLIALSTIQWQCCILMFKWSICNLLVHNIHKCRVLLCSTWRLGHGAVQDTIQKFENHVI